MFQAVRVSSFAKPAFGRVLCTEMFLNLFIESNGALANIETTNLSGASVINSCALRRTLHARARPSTSAADQVVIVIVSIKVDDNIASLTCPYHFQCSEKSEISSTLGNMRPTRYYTRETQAMIPQSSYSLSARSRSLQPASKKRSLRWFPRTVTAPQTLQARLYE